jgi:hypothetical protein
LKDLGLRLATGIVFLTLVIGSILLVNKTVIPFLVFFSISNQVEFTKAKLLEQWYSELLLLWDLLHLLISPFIKRQ